MSEERKKRSRSDSQQQEQENGESEDQQYSMSEEIETKWKFALSDVAELERNMMKPYLDRADAWIDLWLHHRGNDFIYSFVHYRTLFLLTTDRDPISEEQMNMYRTYINKTGSLTFDMERLCNQIDRSEWTRRVTKLKKVRDIITKIWHALLTFQRGFSLVTDISAERDNNRPLPGLPPLNVDPEIDVKDPSMGREEQNNVEDWDKPFYRFIKHVLDNFQLLGYKRYKGLVHEKLFVKVRVKCKDVLCRFKSTRTCPTHSEEENMFTYCWVPVRPVGSNMQDGTEYDQARDGKIKTLVYETFTPKELFQTPWHDFHKNASSMLKVVEYLEDSPDPQFEELRKNRNFFAFKNGMYDLRKTFSFIDFEDDKQTIPSIVACNFLPHYNEVISEWNVKQIQLQEYKAHTHAHPHRAPLPAPPSLTAPILLPMHLPPASDKNPAFVAPPPPPPPTPFLPGDPMAMDTPDVMRILEDQKFPFKVCRWFFVFSGRCWYPLNQLDRWQCQPVFLGLAATGKSTVIYVIITAYHKSNWGILNNQVEKNFSLQPIENSFIWFCLDVREDFNLDFGVWLCMIAGESVNIHVKNKPPRTIEFRIPGTMACNVLPNWKDSAGAASRRMIVFPFRVKVKKGDGDLQKRIEQKYGNYMFKSNGMYRIVARDSGHGLKNIWDLLPPLFHETKKRVRQDTDIVERFLGQHVVQITDNPQDLVDANDFLSELSKYALKTGYKKSIPRTINGCEDVLIGNGNEIIHVNSEDEARKKRVPGVGAFITKMILNPPIPNSG